MSRLKDSIDDAAQLAAPDMIRDSYNAIALSWDANGRAFYGREPEYVDMLPGGIPGGSRVLDPGCGTGRPIAEYVLSKGYRVTDVDQAEALLAMARDMGRYAFIAEKP